VEASDSCPSDSGYSREVTAAKKEKERRVTLDRVAPPRKNFTCLFPARFVPSIYNRLVHFGTIPAWAAANTSPRRNITNLFKN